MTPALIEATDLVRSLMKGTREPLALIDKKGDLLAWNEPAARSLGFEPTQLIGEAFPLIWRSEVENACSPHIWETRSPFCSRSAPPTARNGRSMLACRAPMAC